MKCSRAILVPAILGLMAAAPLAGAADIALTFVHGESRIEVPVSSIVSIEARASTTYRNSETGGEFVLSNPNVEICLSPAMRVSLCHLTQQMVGEPLEVWVNCRVVTKPIVQEPLCAEPCFLLSAFDMKEARRLATELTARPKQVCL